MIKKLLCEKNIMQIYLFVTAIGITATAIVFHIPCYRVFPLYVSLFIMLWQSKVNRFAFLIGGFNSIYYAAIDFCFTLYASALNCLLFSCPMQIISFFSWKKNRVGKSKSTTFKRMSWLQRILLVVFLIAVWLGCCFLTNRTSGAVEFLDMAGSLIGILALILTACCFVEYAIFSVISVGITTTLYLIMIFEGTYDIIPFFIYIIYALVCRLLASKNTSVIYKQQYAANKNKEASICEV